MGGYSTEHRKYFGPNFFKAATKEKIPCPIPFTTHPYCPPFSLPLSLSSTFGSLYHSTLLSWGHTFYNYSLFFFIQTFIIYPFKFYPFRLTFCFSHLSYHYLAFLLSLFPKNAFLSITADFKINLFTCNLTLFNCKTAKPM